MNRKKNMSKLLILTMIFSASMKARAVQSNEKENTDICQSIDENQNVDEKQIIQKCLKLNEDISQVTENFLNCYSSLHRIKLRIDDWFKELENTEGFDKFRKSVWAGRRQSHIMGGSVDIVKKFFGKEKNDEKAEKFKKELLEIIQELVNKLNSYRFINGQKINFNHEYKIDNLIKQFNETNKLYDMSKGSLSSKIKEILDIQKLFILELEENFDKTVDAINQWKKFLNGKNFYEHKICCGCRFSYDEEWLEYNLKSNFMIKHFRQEKIILKNLNKDLEKI
ncbi:MAG: hypothetical protein IJQ10_00525 [Clostridia bacterium]|nr:hypothetical protein [Clostridia bacterium]